MTRRLLIVEDDAALAATLTDELVSADALLFAVPLYNFGVSQHFKTYVDLVITDLGVMEVTEAGLKVTELAPGVSKDQIQAATGVKLDFSAL